MKCISILQPWASLVVTKDPITGKAYKQIETRSRNTKFRGPLLIHASNKWTRDQYITMIEIGADKPLVESGYNLVGLNGSTSHMMTNIPTGAIIGMVNVVETFPFCAVWPSINKRMGLMMNERYVEFTEQEVAFGDYSSIGRYGWLLSDPILFQTPIPCKGNLSIWNLPGELEDTVIRELSNATGEMWFVGLNGEPLQNTYNPIASPAEGAVVVEGVKPEIKTVGQLLTEAFTLNKLKAEVVEMELGFPAGMITKMMNDEFYTNSVPIILFKNLIESLHIRPSEVYKAMIPTFNAVLAKETPETIKKKPHGYQLWENKDAVKKYTERLKHLIANGTDPGFDIPESKPHLPSRGIDGHDENKKMWNEFLMK